MELVVPDSAALKTPPSEPWFEEEDRAFFDVSEGDDGSTITNEDVTRINPFSSVQESFNRTSDILAEDCSHLLRKAQAAITKSYRLP